MINLNAIDFQDAPAGFALDGLYGTQIADLEDGGQIIVALDVDTQEASLAYNPGKDAWHDSIATQDWGALDRAFGRSEWQAFLAEWEEQALADLEEDDE